MIIGMNNYYCVGIITRRLQIKPELKNINNNKYEQTKKNKKKQQQQTNNFYDARKHTEIHEHKQGKPRLLYSLFFNIMFFNKRFHILSCLSIDLALFPMPDPWNTRQFRFNEFDLHWEEGLPPNFEQLLYVTVGDERFLIGRYIQSCQVTTSTQMGYIYALIS